MNWKELPGFVDDLMETDTQRRTLTMLRDGLTWKQISYREQISVRNVAERSKRMRKLILAAGYDPENGMTLVSPFPQILKGRTALVKINPETGEEKVSHYYNKTDVDKNKQLEQIKEGILQAAESFRPIGIIKKPRSSASEYCTVYTITDYHLGAYSWGDETGADWDIRIAKEVIIEAIADMMAGSPDSELAVFAQLGDFLHFDGLLALTPTAKNVLDADTRFPLIVQTAIELCINAVEMLLNKHSKVHVLMAEGNHDLASSVWMRAVMAQAFKNNPRVSVESSPFPFYTLKFGDVFLCWHHGHLQKMDRLPLLFATDPKFRVDHGNSKYTYIHTGHLHHQRVLEQGGILVEQHPTLTARDAHGARGFLFSQREAKAITYHAARGEVQRVTVRPKMREKNA